jgi:hypothetical protein
MISEVIRPVGKVLSVLNGTAFRLYPDQHTHSAAASPYRMENNFMSSPANAIDYFTAADIAQDIHRIETIYATNILGPSSAGHPLVKSAFIEVMVCLPRPNGKNRHVRDSHYVYRRYGCYV